MSIVVVGEISYSLIIIIKSILYSRTVNDAIHPDSTTIFKVFVLKFESIDVYTLTSIHLLWIPISQSWVAWRVTFNIVSRKRKDIVIHADVIDFKCTQNRYRIFSSLILNFCSIIKSKRETGITVRWSENIKWEIGA